MKQLLYFLIGFSLSLVIASVSFGGILYPPDGTDLTPYEESAATSGYYPSATPETDQIDFFTDQTAMTDYINSFGGAYGRGYVTNPGTCTVGYVWYIIEPGGQWAWIQVCFVQVASCVDPDGIDLNDFLDSPPEPDADGDGNPDATDMYPNDPTPYSVKLVSYQTIDGSADGEHVREVYITDRGDFISIGADYDENKTDVLLHTSPWFDGADLAGTTNPNSTQDDLLTQTTPDQGTYNTDYITGEAANDIATGMASGSQSSGTETDNEALKSIIDNTGKTADNVNRLGDYMQDLNQAIQNMDRNIALSGSLLTDPVDSPEIEFPEVDQGDQDNLNNLDIEGALNGNISGEIVEGVDYDQPGALGDETFFSEFFASNPLFTAFDNSGFQSSDSVCSVTLDLGDMGTHELSLCEFQVGFQAFGNLLFAFCGIGSLIMIVRG